MSDASESDGTPEVGALEVGALEIDAAEIEAPEVEAVPRAGTPPAVLPRGPWPVMRRRDPEAARQLDRAIPEDALLSARTEAPLPSLVLRPERVVPADGPLDRSFRRLQSLVVPGLAARRRRRLERVLPLAEALRARCEAASDAELDAMLAREAHALRRARDFPLANVARTFAIVRELSGRVLGQRHYDVQLLGAHAMLHGMLAEMATGEGKTLTATLAAGVAALAGLPVHVITVNDYLASRDAEHLRPLYTRMGLSVGVIVAGQSTEERRLGYACDIVYCTNKEVAFDYLRDRIALGEHHDNLRLKLERLHSREPRAHALRQRGLHFALVDEADSVLVDEARTPLIISAPAKSDVYAATAGEAVALARQLQEGEHFRLIESQRRVVLTLPGQQRITSLAAELSQSWRNPIIRDELASQAIAALHLYTAGEHYLVKDGEIQIVDEYTGRIMPDRKWSSGLHQMIEAKEGCEVSRNRETIARITYQKLFRRYGVLAGMSGTLRPIARELWSVYRLATVPIPTHRPPRRLQLPDLVFPTEERKWAAIIARVRDFAAAGKPVLVGTRSVAASELLSERFAAEGLEHVVLNAAQDAKEAEVVAQAGRPGAITIATNMAGRGTDIKVAPEALAVGGLHVIMSERHDARRIDDQLAGRCARQGEPGCFQAFLSLEDPLVTAQDDGLLDRLVKAALRRRPNGAARTITYCQKRIERLHLGMRRDLLNADQAQRRLHAFSGQVE